MEYTRLPGKKKGFYRKCTLWLGEDHILAVESNYYSERYKRFYFKDFQALIVRKTNRFANLNIFMGIAIGIAALLLLLSILGHYIGWIIFIGLALLSLVISLVIHLKRGPTCACNLKMPFAVHELPSLCRLKYARRVLEQLAPLVQGFQGALSVDEIRTKIHEKISRQSPVHFSQVGTIPPRKQAEEYSCFVHIILFGLLLLDSFFGLLKYHSDHPAIHAVNLIAGLVVIIFVIAALVRQSGRSLPRMVKGLVWTVLAVVCSSNLFVGVYFMSVVGSRKPDAIQLDNIIRNPAKNPVMAKVYIGCIIAGTILGVWGLAAILLHRSKAEKRISVSADDAVSSLGENVQS